MKKLLEDLREVETKIYEWFGTTTSWLAISDMTDEFWDTDGQSVWWSDEEVHFTDPELDPTYGEDIKHNNVYDEKGFTLVNLNLSTGDEGAYVFDNSKRRTNEYEGY